MKKFVIALSIFCVFMIELNPAVRVVKIDRIKIEGKRSGGVFGGASSIHAKVYIDQSKKIWHGNIYWMGRMTFTVEQLNNWYTSEVYTTREIEERFEERDRNIDANNKGIEDNKKKLEELEKSTKDLISNSINQLPQRILQEEVMKNLKEEVRLEVRKEFDAKIKKLQDQIDQLKKLIAEKNDKR